jgi:hypothetical protein
VSDFGLFRCGYVVDDRWQSLDCDVSLEGLSSGARGELESILARIAAGQAAGGEPLPAERSIHFFHLNVRERWIFDLEITSSGSGAPITVECLSQRDLPRIAVAAPELSAALHAKALEALLSSSGRPRRALAWQPLALARFVRPPQPVDGAVTGAGEPSPNRQLFNTLLEPLLAAPSTSYASRLAALLVPSVDLLSESEAARLLAADVTAVQVLPLTLRALDGDEQALYEIFRLALEYAGDPAVFVAAARRLFPEALNPALVARHPPGRDRDEAPLLLGTVRRFLERAEYASGPTRAWTLPVE